MSNPSASNCGRAIACPASLVLPQVNSTSRAAEVGIEIHAFLEVVAEHPDQWDAALAHVSVENRQRCANIDLAEALHGLHSVETEISFAYNPRTDTCRRIGKSLQRKYGDLSADEIATTLDVVAECEIVIGQDPIVTIPIPAALDWKSGMNVGAVRDNWQLRIQALALARYNRAPDVQASVCYID